MRRTTEISIHGQQVECRYLIKDGIIEHLNLKLGGGWCLMNELLLVDELYLALDAHHQNLLLEENS